MNSRHIRFVFTSILLLAVTVRADDPQTKSKLCNAPAAECERAIREMASGRRYLGAMVEEIHPGVRISSIIQDSPARRGGLGEGDRIMMLNGHSMLRADIKEFKRVMSQARETGWVSFLVSRNGVLRRVELRLEPYTKAQIDKMVAQHMTEAHPQSVTSTQPQP